MLLFPIWPAQSRVIGQTLTGNPCGSRGRRGRRPVPNQDITHNPWRYEFEPIEQRVYAFAESRS